MAALQTKKSAHLMFNLSAINSASKRRRSQKKVPQVMRIINYYHIIKTIFRFFALLGSED